MKTRTAFYKLCLTTLFAVYFLILVGGIVRSTGSGMGCPDWPKCFGTWVPPTSVNDLPPDYKETYAEFRNKKNQRFAKYLNAMGMDETATALLNDKSVLVEADFNPVKTWIEYLNRIVGVVIGLLIFAVFVVSWRLRREDSKVFIVALLALVLVGIQGWIGSFVVSTNLTPWTVTLHMFLALVIVGMLVYLVHRSSASNGKIQSRSGFWWIIGCIVVLLVQILLGTQVREAIDEVSKVAMRSEWMSSIEADFILHRSFSWIVLLMHAGLIFSIRKTEASKGFKLTLILLILGTIFTGAGMARFNVPAFLQPAHLLFATMSIGVQFLFLLKVNRKNPSVLLNWK